MKYKLLFIAFIPFFAFAQSSLEEVKKRVFSNPNSTVNQNYIRLFNEKNSEDYFKDYFRFENWQDMEVFGKGNLHIVVDSANYHIEEDRVYFVENGEYYKLFPEQVDSLVISDAVFKCYDTGEDNAKVTLGYFEVLTDGDLALLKKQDIRRKKKSSHPMGISTNNEMEIVKRSKLHYYDHSKKEIAEVPGGKGKLLKIFGRKKNKMMSFARKRNLSMGSEEDVTLMFRYYNTLMKNES